MESLILKKKKFGHLVLELGGLEYYSNVLKPGPDRTVRPEKLWTAHHHGSFMLKNRSMPKMQGTVWTAVQPHGSENRDWTASHGSFESEP